MNKIIQKGTASLIFETPVYIESTASVAGKKEGEGPLGAFIDRIFSDPMFGQDTWEAAESAMQKETRHPGHGKSRAVRF